MDRRFLEIIIITAIIGAAVFPLSVFASITDGVIDSTNKYAWSENIGWINFGVSGGNVHITDSAITGYGWSPNYGWINLNPPTSGVKNDSYGDLSGYAWGENLGWIDFNGVSINSGGEFSGYDLPQKFFDKETYAIVLKTLFQFENKNISGFLFLVNSVESLDWLKKAIHDYMKHYGYE